MAKKKAFLVMPRNKNAAESGLVTGKGTLDFKGKTSMMIGDESLAREVDTQHGLKASGDVWVAEDQRGESFLRDDGVQGHGVHRYFWGQSPRYARAWDNFEARRTDKTRNVDTGVKPEA
jgi:hypothetical protein